MKYTILACIQNGEKIAIKDFLDTITECRLDNGITSMSKSYSGNCTVVMEGNVLIHWKSALKYLNVKGA